MQIKVLRVKIRNCVQQDVGRELQLVKLALESSSRELSHVCTSTAMYVSTGEAFVSIQ